MIAHGGGLRPTKGDGASYHRKYRAGIKAREAPQGGTDGSKAAQAAVSHIQPAAAAAPAKRRLYGASAEQQQGPCTKRPCLGPLPPPSAGVPPHRQGPIAPQPPAAPAAAAPAAAPAAAAPSGTRPSAPAPIAPCGRSLRFPAPAPAPHPYAYAPGYPYAPPPCMAQAGWGQPATYPYGPYAYLPYAYRHHAYLPYAAMPPSYAQGPYAPYPTAPFHTAPAAHPAPSAAPSRFDSGAVAGYPAPPALGPACEADLEAAWGDVAVSEVLDFLESDGEGDSPPCGPASAAARAGREAARTPAKAPCSRASAPGPAVCSPNVLSPFKAERMDAAATHCLVRKLLLGEEGEEEVPCSPAARQALPELALLVGLIARDDAAGR
ncbi:hypothetical protein HYH03_007106 [Edaphochlamys debaryana]|nr:hypothetical protein HYH03_007106 [Edaphochlamys debaryana]|eukprot:KAG2494866.1 hypothetical protein HYH03_007106 [Edaphochlamys debaryana]